MSVIGSEAATYQRLRDHLHVLRLFAAAEALPGMLDDARGKDLSTATMLEQLLAETTQARRLRFACLPTQSRLDEIDFAAQPGVDEKLIRELVSLRFLDDAGNVVFVGPPLEHPTVERLATAAPTAARPRRPALVPRAASIAIEDEGNGSVEELR